MQRLTICVPYHDGLTYLLRCVRSLRDHPPGCGHEVLVIDDASPTPCAQAVAGEHAAARTIRAETNIGFAAAANLALRQASGRYLLFLNCDAEVRPGALDALVSTLDERPGVGAVGPMLLNTDGTIQPQGKRGRLTPMSGLAYSLGLDRLFPGVGQLAEYMRPGDRLDRPTDTEALSGSCMMLRREALEAIDRFDERMFLYGEDLDLCYRLRNAGWIVAYEPRARVTHVGGRGGTRRNFLRSQYHYHRSLGLLFAKHPPSSWYWVYSWAVNAGLGMRFLALSASYLAGRRRIGTRKASGPRPARPVISSPADAR